MPTFKDKASSTLDRRSFLECHPSENLDWMKLLNNSLGRNLLIHFLNLSKDEKHKHEFDVPWQYGSLWGVGLNCFSKTLSSILYVNELTMSVGCWDTESLTLF